MNQITLPFTTLPELIQFISKSYSNREHLGYKKNGQWIYLSTEELVESIQNVGAGLLELGIKPGDKIGLMATPSPFWIIMDQAILSIGCVTVPMFSNIAPSNLEYQLNEAEVKTIVIQDKEQAEILKPFQKKIKNFIYMGESPVDSAISYMELKGKGSSAYKDHKKTISDQLKKIKPDDLATLIYTSGSTGVPKGVEISHGNLVSQIKGSLERFPLDSALDKALTTLPLAHVFERMVTQYYLAAGITIAFAEDVKKVGENLREIKPTMITLVPRLLEKVFAKMKSGVDEATGLKKFLGSNAIERASSKSYLDRKSIVDILFDKLVYKKMRQAMGGNLKVAMSGSAALSPDLANFFLNIGLPIFEGYGCTETAPVIAANYDGHRKVGTVGPAFPGVEVKIAEDNEILAKGPNVMNGYYKNEAETKKAIDSDGFYHTGDLGSIDGDGYLKITGRKKELFKTANGKYVAPVPIESAIVNKSEYVDMALIIGETRKFTSILIFPDFENITKHKESLQLGYMSHGEFLDCPQYREKIQGSLDEINSNLNHWEQVQKFVVAGNPLTVESGELTPTMKIRRHIVEEKFKTDIESMYKE